MTNINYIINYVLQMINKKKCLVVLNCDKEKEAGPRKRIPELFQDHFHCSVLPWDDLYEEDIRSKPENFVGTLKKEVFNGFSLIILSGGGGFKTQKVKRKQELEYYRSCDNTIFAICMGFQILMKAYSKPELLMYELSEKDKYIRGKKSPKKVRKLPISFCWRGRKFDGMIHYSHDFAFGPFLNHLHELEVTSFDDYIEKSTHHNAKIVTSFQHPTKKIFGVQGHPEIYPEELSREIVSFLREICE